MGQAPFIDEARLSNMNTAVFAHIKFEKVLKCKIFARHRYSIKDNIIHLNVSLIPLSYFIHLSLWT